jgi:hypothetical protein
LIPLTVAIWLYTSCKELSKFAYIVIEVPFASLTLIVVISLSLFGYKMKFYCAFDFLENLEAYFFGSDKLWPEPENATYGGGGGGTYFYEVLSDKLTETPPVGYFFFNYFGTYLNNIVDTLYWAISWIICFQDLNNFWTLHHLQKNRFHIMWF